MMGICSFIIGICAYLYNRRRKSAAENKWIVKCYVFSFLAAVIVTAVLWLPAVYEIFLYGGEDSSVSAVFKESTNVFLTFLNAFMCSTQYYKGCSPLIYCGIAALILNLIYFFNKNISRRERGYAVLLLLIFGCLFSVSPLDYVMHGFDTPQCFVFRYSFAVSFLMCIIGCRQALLIRTIEKKNYIIVSIACVSLFALFHFLNNKIWGKNLRLCISGVVFNAVFILLWLVMFWVISKKKTDGISAAVFVTFIVCVELCINGMDALVEYNDDAYEKEAYDNTVISEKNTLEDINDSVEPDIYRTQWLSMLKVNNALENDLMSTSWFNSFEQYDLEMALYKLGMMYAPHTIYGGGMTEPLKALMGVKVSVNSDMEYFEESNICIPKMCDPENDIISDCHKLYGVEKSPWYVNEKYLSLGYMVDEKICDFEFTDSPFDNLDGLMSAMMGEEVKCYSDVEATLDCECGSISFYERGASKEDDEALDKFGADGAIVFKRENVDDNALFSFTVAHRDRPVLMYLKRGFEHGITGEINLIDNTPIKEYSSGIRSLSPCYIYELSPDENGDCSAFISLSEGTTVEAIEKAYFAEYDRDEFIRVYDRLSQEQLEIGCFADGYLKGTVEAKEDGILFTSIPFDEGWHIYVDGAEEEAISLVENAFVGVRLSKGEHEIEMKYVNPVFKIACVISFAGIMLCGMICIINRRKETRIKNGKN